MAKKKAAPSKTRGSGPLDKDYGNRLRAYRIERGLSQETLGDQLGVSFQQIQKYEKGTNRLSAVRLVQIAGIFGITPHELLGWNGSLKLDTPIDAESFKLAQAFTNLRHELKPAFRALINTVMRGDEA